MTNGEICLVMLAVAMPFAMRNGQICFSFLPVPTAAQWETGRIRLWRARLQSPNSVSFLGRTECVRANSLFSADLIKFGTELTDFALSKQHSQNRIPPVSCSRSRKQLRCRYCDALRRAVFLAAPKRGLFSKSAKSSSHGFRDSCSSKYWNS